MANDFNAQGFYVVVGGNIENIVNFKTIAYNHWLTR